MGRCIAIAGLPISLSFQLPGGAKLGSMASATQQVPNLMDPFQSLLQAAQPALAAMKPVFEIINFIMKLMQILIAIFQVIGTAMFMLAGPNPFSAIFYIEGMPNPADIVKFLQDNLLPLVIGLLAAAMGLAGLVPQLSIPLAIKDAIITALAFADAIMAQVNTLADALSNIPPADTGNSLLDALLQCAAANADTQLAHKLGPLANLIPLMAMISLFAELAKQKLPPVILTMAKIVTTAMPDLFLDLRPLGPSPAEQRDKFLDTIEDMVKNGLPIDIPDFSDLSTIPVKLQELQAQLGPVLPVIEMIQSIFSQLAKG